MNDMTTATFLGYRYDEDKLNQYEEKIEERKEESYDAIPNMEYIDELEGQYREYSVCACCGKLITRSFFGYGATCAQKMLQSINVVSKISPEFNEVLTDYALRKWSAYSDIVKELYIRANSNDKGELKKFRNEFKKSFIKSVLENETGRFSRKQVDVMKNDIERQIWYDERVIEKIGKDNYDMLGNKLGLIKLHDPELHHELIGQFDDVVHQGDIVKFVRITYKKAWIDNPWFNGETKN